eukprot:5792983-Prorocentrum_lima.AAC.1
MCVQENPIPPIIFLSKKLFHTLKNISNRRLRCHQLRVTQLTQLPGQNREAIKFLHHQHQLE